MNQRKKKKPPQPETELSQELQAKCNKVRALLVKAGAANKPAYQIGFEVNAVRRDTSAYGSGGVQAMARELGCTTALLYSYAVVAEAWKEAAFTAMSEKLNGKGVPLSFSHFIAIANAAPKTRQDLFQAALNDSLSVRALKKAGGATSEKRKRKADTGLLAIVDRLLNSTSTALEHAEEVSEGLAHHARAPSTAMPSPEQLHTIIETYRKLDVLNGLIRMQLQGLLGSGRRSPEDGGERPIALLLPARSGEATPSGAGEHASRKAVGA